MDALDHGKRVLATILLSGNVKALSYAQRRLTETHFADTTQRAVYLMAVRYAEQTGGVLTRDALLDALRDRPPGTQLFYTEFWDSLARHTPAASSDFIHSVGQLRDLAAERLTGEALAQGMEVLTKGAEDGRRFLKGHADARSWVQSQFAEIERELSLADAPEGDMRREKADIVAAYSAAEADRKKGTGAIPTGIPRLDRALGGGLRRGELDLIMAFTSVGKTGWCCQLSWNAVTLGKNVVYFTSETLRQQIRVKILSRHSRGFTSTGRGLNSRDIKAGTLSMWCPDGRHERGSFCSCGKEAFLATLEDWETNPAYGKLYVAQVPRGATVSTLESRLARITRDWDADLVIIDYLMLLRSETSYRSKRETLSEIVNDGKGLATSYKGGQGVPVVSPWQVNKEGYDLAKASGVYDLTATGETAEARNTADLVLSLLDTGDSPNSESGRNVPLRLGIPKNRDGERGHTIDLIADYATSCFSEAEARVQQFDQAADIGES